MSELNDAAPGRYFSRTDGSLWRVIGHFSQPTVFLARSDCEMMPIELRTHHAVDPTSLHAEDWHAATDQEIESFGRRSTADLWVCGDDALRAQVALRIIVANRISDGDTIDKLEALIDVAGKAFALDFLMDEVPF